VMDGFKPLESVDQKSLQGDFYFMRPCSPPV
jgi:hypothetical protein